MKIFILLFFSMSIFAKSDCSIYFLSGEVIYKDQSFFLLIAKDTISQKKVRVHFLARPKLAPYENLHVKLQGTINSSMLKANSTLLDVQEIEPTAHSAHNLTEEKNYRKIEEIKCPSLPF